VLIDSHCHLDRLSYGELHQDIADVLNKARARGVSHFLSVSVTLESFPAMLAAIEPFDNVFASCGVHPLNQEQGVAPEILRRLASHPRVVAIGETGLDYYYSPENKAIQQQAFATHVEVARELRKPLVVHTRDARDDTLAILRDHGAEQVGGVLHCFTESLPMAEAAMELGFYISISGIITFNNAKALREVVKALPLERLLVETDSPYLAPVPYRGKENQPAYVRAVAEYIAELKGISYEQLAEQTSRNFFALFPAAA